MKCVLYIVLFFFSWFCAKTQIKGFPKRYINNLFNDTTSTSKPQFIYYPVLAYAPETSFEIGLSGLHVHYAKNDTTNRLSEMNAFVFFTFAKQYGGFFEHALYSDKNKWFFLGKMKFQSFPLSYFGIGTNTTQKIARVDAFQIQLKERILHKIAHDFYGGLEFDFHSLSNVSFHEVRSSDFIPPPGSHGSNNIGLGFGLLHDNRHNVLNVRKGFFAETALLHYSTHFGSDFEFTTIITDWRLFRPVRKRNVLAFQFLGQVTLGHPPFNQMALMGGETIMRGYYTGRYRDKNLAAFQIEYRMLPFSFVKRLGATLFAGTATVSNEIGNFQSKNLVLAGGAGLRFLLFPKKDVWTRVDLGLTKEGHGIYIYVGEAF
ncbi:MAG TPA: BamA/TamA family outer membrane protein [Flavobacteriales bacterium]|nr:BamA/TamA family outer membrane protein [Flavobacteriales bacterium]